MRWLADVVCLPRQLLRNSTYLLTRRCSERRFFLRPSSLTNQIALYCMALAAEKTGVKVHAFCWLSNHAHWIVSDPDSRLPEFMQLMLSLVARTLNASYGRWENLWEGGGSSYSAVRLESPESALAKLIYVLANPVDAGLVRHAHDWPGLWSAPRDMIADPLTVVRPSIFFRKEDDGGALPLEASLRLERLPGFDHLSDDQLRALIQERFAAREAEIHQEFKTQGRSFVGRKGVLACKPTDSPDTKEQRRGLDPRIAEPDPDLRKLALCRLLDFWADYRVAWLRLRAHAAGVVFPRGTYHLRRFLGVACADTA